MLTPEEIADLAELQSRERQWRWLRWAFVVVSVGALVTAAFMARENSIALWRESGLTRAVAVAHVAPGSSHCPLPPLCRNCFRQFVRLRAHGEKRPDE